MKKFHLFSLFFLIVSPFFLIFTKRETHRISNEIGKISRNISKNREKINTLHTEIDFLTRPKRIEKITQYLYGKKRE